ncbi:PAS domain S-box protein [Legionella sp. MW5194]|uniref:MASE3 domain-containing protein n=1 Tax=Legionella sp. MW5194 TaxID=2662448 RepID=UPI00193D3C31|nr:MASE3 domain-containing protein [Legionella sp. MW5194]QRN04619.1 PAS domain S-box protein [Legionella sp. MW5194]
MDDLGKVAYFGNTPAWPLALKAFLPPAFLSLICIIIGHYAGFLAFHTLAELITINISLIAMTVAITSTRFTKNQFVVIISLTCGWCACLDIVHVLVYQGMSIIPATGGNESTQLWIAARFIQALSFLGATYFFRHTLRVWIFNLILFILISLVFSAVFSGYFPQTFINGYGVTPFKTYSEWVIILVLCIAWLLLWKNRNLLTKTSLFYLSMSILTMIITEIALSQYTSLFGIENSIGHTLRIFSYWFIYVALVIQTLTNPFSLLGQAANTYDHIPDATLIVQPDGSIRQANRAAGLMRAMTAETLVGKASHGLFHNKEIPQAHCPVCSQLPHTQNPFAAAIETSEGFWVECSLSPIHSEFFPDAWVQVIRDITSRKRLEMEQSRLTQALGERIKELQGLYRISEYSGRKSLNIEAFFAETARQLPLAFQFPELMVANIESIWGKFSSTQDPVFVSEPLIKEFSIDSKSSVRIEVGYHRLPSPSPDALFLPEEAALLDSVATILANTVERILYVQQITMSRASEKYFQAFIEKAGIGVYVRNKEKFLYVNPRFCEIVGQSKESLLNTGLMDLVKDQPARAFILKHWALLDQGQTNLTYTLPYRRPDGVTVTLRIDVTAISWLGNFQYLSLVQDISEIQLARQKIEDYVARLEKAIKGTFRAVSNMVEFRDPYTAGHEYRVGLIAKAIGQELGWPPARCASLELMGLVHDIGKIAIPAEILVKPSKLTAIEMELIKNHSQTGYDILKDVHLDAPVAEVILQHHERLDGSGYPRGLKRSDILPETRVISVADVLEAMSSHRPYRPALGIDAAVAEIQRGRGLQYDAEVVDAVLKLIHENRLPLHETRPTLTD